MIDDAILSRTRRRVRRAFDARDARERSNEFRLTESPRSVNARSRPPTRARRRRARTFARGVDRYRIRDRSSSRARASSDARARVACELAIARVLDFIARAQAVSLAAVTAVVLSATPAAFAATGIELTDKRVENQTGLQLIYEVRRTWTTGRTRAGRVDRCERGKPIRGVEYRIQRSRSAIYA